MSITLRLDTPAVRRLIEDDPEFHLELTRACVAEIVRQVVLRDAGKVLELIDPAVHKAILTNLDEQSYVRKAMGEALEKLVERTGDYYTTTWKPTGTSKQKLDAAFKPTIDAYIAEVTRAGSALMEEAAQKAIETVNERIDKRIERRLEEHIAAEVDRRVTARFNAALAAAKEA